HEGSKDVLHVVRAEAIGLGRIAQRLEDFQIPDSIDVDFARNPAATGVARRSVSRRKELEGAVQTRRRILDDRRQLLLMSRLSGVVGEKLLRQLERPIGGYVQQVGDARELAVEVYQPVEL